MEERIKIFIRKMNAKKSARKYRKNKAMRIQKLETTVSDYKNDIDNLKKQLYTLRVEEIQLLKEKIELQVFIDKFI